VKGRWFCEQEACCVPADEAGVAAGTAVGLERLGTEDTRGRRPGEQPGPGGTSIDISSKTRFDPTLRVATPDIERRCGLDDGDVVKLQKRNQFDRSKRIARRRTLADIPARRHTGYEWEMNCGVWNTLFPSVSVGDACENTATGVAEVPPWKSRIEVAPTWALRGMQ
jgi:hypothetical protein